MKNIIRKIFITFILGCLSTSVYSEGLSLGKTRIIFSGKDKSEIINVINDDDKPYLIQSGVMNNVNDRLSSNFVTIPPLFRLEGKNTSSLRVLLNDTTNLPKDRESLFYLNVKAIPSTKKIGEDDAPSKLVFITNIVIKVFYRPLGIDHPQDDSYKRIKLISKGNKWLFDNPTAYYMTLTNVKFNKNKYSKSILLSPYSTTMIDNIDSSINQASWHIINDYGELSKEFSLK